MLNKVDTVDFSDFDGAEENRPDGRRSLFLRAYAYYKLFNIYGSVPLVTERFSVRLIPTRRAVRTLTY